MRELTPTEVTGLTIVMLAGLVLCTKVLLELISMIGEVVQRSFEAGNVEYNDCTFEGLQPPKMDTISVSIPSHIAINPDDHTDTADEPEADCEHGTPGPEDPRAGGDLSPR